MRIILSNHQLQHREGSELLTLEVGEALMARGHEVRVFTPTVGPFAEVVAESLGRVLTYGDEAEVRDFEPDIINANDWVSLMVLQNMGLSGPAVLGVLGVVPPVASPPPLDSGQRLPWWGVSHEVLDHVARISGWRESPSALLPTWFDDRSLWATAPRRRDLRSVLIVSNRMPEAMRNDFRRIGGDLGISVTHVGLPGPQRIIDAAYLRSFDAVVSLGRTAVMALAVGIPTLICDIHGADGWVDPARLTDIAGCNFSGRALRMEVTSDRIRGWLLSPPTTEEVRELQHWAWDNRRLTMLLDRFESMLESEAGRESTWHFGIWSRAVADLKRQQYQTDRELKARAGALASADARESAARDRLAELEADLDDAHRRNLRLQGEYDYLSERWAKWTLQRWRRRGARGSPNANGEPPK